MSGSVSCGVTAPFPWVLVHTSFCLCPPRVEPLFPLPCGSPVIESYWPWKLDSLENPNPFAGSLGWEAWHEAQNLHKSEGTSLVLLFSRLWFIHLAGMRFDFIMVIQLLLCLWTWGIFFGGFQHPLVNGCSRPGYNLGALTGDEHTSYSTILTWKPLYWN